MSQVIVIASGKGGTGKTTVCASLAVSLANKNKKVLVVDCDSGMRGVDLMLGIDNRLVYDMSDIVCGNCDVNSAVYQVRDLPLYVIAAPISAEDEIAKKVFKQFVDKLKGDYDYVLIDSPAGTGTGFDIASYACDRAIIVVNAEPISVRGGQTIRRKLLDSGIEDIRLLINRFDKERFYMMGLYSDLDEVIDAVGCRLIGVVPEDDRINALSQRGYIGLHWSPCEVVFDSIVCRVEGYDAPLLIE